MKRENGKPAKQRIKNWLLQRKNRLRVVDTFVIGSIMTLFSAAAVQSPQGADVSDYKTKFPLDTALPAVDAAFNGEAVVLSNVPENFREVVLNSWIARGLEVALPALLITGMGGALASVIKAAPAINDLAGLIEQSGVPGLLIPFLIGAIMFTAVGSMTTGGMTAAGVVGPMMGALGLTPVATVLAIGAGTMIFNHVNNSGFWVISRFFNLDLKQGLKYITLPDAVAGVFCFVLICAAAAVGLF